jgi:predicted ATPase
MAASRLKAALALWRGAALPELADRPYAQPEIARLEDLRLQAIEDRLDADLAVGRHLEVISELRALAAEHPLRERFWYQLMLVLYRAGRQGEALHVYQNARQVLADELGVDPNPELQKLHVAILRQDSALAQTDTPIGWLQETLNNLPAHLTSFIGREEPLQEIGELLQAVRLVTITGVGGVGKSRLATEIAATQLTAYPDGVWIVELAPLTDPRLITPTTSSVLGVREHPDRSLLDVLVARLRPAAALLVLDNCEHLVAGVAEFTTRLLEGCPRLRILCTSRERLRITEEMVRPISGLRVPEADGATNLRQVDAVKLFAERAAAVQTRFELSDPTAAAVGEICRRLDGLPLAIELAAARVNTYSPLQIAARLDDRFRLLTRGSRIALPRHQTLRAVVDWSYDLLDEDERLVFDQLSVFRGGFTLEAADAICIDSADGGDLPEVMAGLVDKSLVMAEAVASPEYRYRILETLRAYGTARLDARGETDQLRTRHAAFFHRLAVAASNGLRGADQPVWLERLSAEHDNLRAALEYSLAQGSAETAAEMASALYPFWDLRGHYTEGRRWLTRVLAAPGISERARTRALMGVATLAIIQGDVEQAVTACEEAATLSRRAGDGAGLAHALQYLALIAIYADDQNRAPALLEKSLEAARAADATWELGWSLEFSAVLALARAEFERAADLSRQSDAVLKPVGDQEALAWNILIRGVAAWGQANLKEASARIRDALRAWDHLGGLWGISLTLLFQPSS